LGLALQIGLLWMSGRLLIPLGCCTPRDAPKIRAVSAALAEINARESDIREQFNAGKIPGPVFKSWLAEFVKQRDAINRRRRRSPRESRTQNFCGI
jgi:hypothetical protein